MYRQALSISKLLCCSIEKGLLPTVIIRVNEYLNCLPYCNAFQFYEMYRCNTFEKNISMPNVGS